jgi:choice-of-anchor A domain-containing protein
MGRPSGTLKKNSPAFTMSQFTVPLNALEAHLSTLAPNSTATLAFGTLTFHVTPGPNGVAVFDIPVTQLQVATSITFTAVSAHVSIIVNVTGPNLFTYSQGFAGNPPTSCSPAQQPCFNNQLIWNFRNAGTLNLF